jgi:transposase
VAKAPEEILDAEHEQMFQRVCAVDVAKDAGKVCVRVPASSASGRRVSKVWEVKATFNAVTELAGQLVDAEIEKVTIESTSDYWRIWFYVLEAHGLDVQLVNAREAKHAPGRPKTDKLDSIWLAKLTEKGLLRPSFVPPAEIRVLRDYTRLRTDLTRERTRYWSRLEKLLEDSLIKVSAVASSLDTASARDMIEALIAGERDPRVLAELARGRMRTKNAALVEALTGRFDDHHAELARLLLDQIDALSGQIDKLTARIEQLLADLPGGGNDSDQHEHDGDGDGDGAGGCDCAQADCAHRHLTRIARSAVERLDEIPGIGPLAAHVIIAEVGVDMSRFPTADHLVSWAKLSPRTLQSGAKNGAGKVGKGNPYLKGVLGQAAAVAARTDTFLGERFRRIVKRRGKLRALVAVARSLLISIWHLLADPYATFRDLGSDYYLNRLDTGKKIRSHVRQLEALGLTVTLTQAA